ncbi:hypothetical protein QOT17_009587 [Balamuthia mandrillaris]
MEGDEEVNVEQWNSANIERWYEPIKDFTFKTVFLPLKQDSAAALSRACLVRLSGGTEQQVLEHAQDGELLEELERVLEEAIRPFREAGNAAFVKLSSRSPKDATVASGKTDALYQEIIERFQQEGRVIDDNAKVCALYEAHLSALKVFSGKEALELLSSSGRIQQDIQLLLDTKHNDFDLQVIVREWVNIPISNEFRGFVYENRLTAVTQYFDMCYFPELNQHETRRAQVLQQLEKTFTKAKPNIPLSSYIIDFCISQRKASLNEEISKEGEDDGGDKVYIIELNPWSSFTDAGLFSWVKDAPLLRGEEQTEEQQVAFRVRDRPIQKARFEVLTPWKKYFS